MLVVWDGRDSGSGSDSTDTATSGAASSDEVSSDEER